VLSGIPEVSFENSPPVCPDPAVSTCVKNAGHCPKGQIRHCVQKWTIFDKGCLRHIYFTFTVSSTDTDGIVDEFDSQLNVVLKSYAINKSSLPKVA
jgi:hypothetical protein